MSWDWLFVIILVLFVGMRFFGRGGGCCGGHGSQPNERRRDRQPEQAEGSPKPQDNTAQLISEGHEREPEEEPVHRGCH